MKLNTDPMEIPESAALQYALGAVFGNPEAAPRTVIETGTFTGTGSTRTIIKAIEDAGEFRPAFYTIEVNGYHYGLALENLSRWPWVIVKRGLSVGKREALEFLENDRPFLTADADYPNLLKDTLGDPVGYYRQEILSYDIPEDNILEKLITGCQDPVFFCLDSAGGLGSLEFTKTVHLMKQRPLYMLLDDIGHVKHHRSAQAIRNWSEWQILYETERVMLAKKL